jgi:nucleoredoxin
MINFSKILVFTFLLISLLKFKAGAEVHPVVQKLIPGNLIDQNFNQVNSENLEGKIIGLYFSAGWCPPCRTFSPTLKEFREQNKEDFEVVMISADRNLDEQLQYMQSAKMPWPALSAGSYEANNLYSIFEVRGIPTLIIISPNGQVISTNGRNEVIQKKNSAMNEWKNSDSYAEFRKENKNTSDTKDPTDQDKENVNYQEEIKRLNEENAKKDAQITALTKRAEECKKLANGVNEDCAVIQDELNQTIKDLTSALAENQSLKDQLSVALQSSEACSTEVVELRKQLEQCKTISNAPYVSGWVFTREKGWIYTSPEVFPFVFLESSSTWYLYQLGSAAPRQFFNYQTQEWEEWE